MRRFSSRILFPSCPQGLQQQYFVLCPSLATGAITFKDTHSLSWMYISGQEVLLLCFRAGNLYHGREPLYLPSSPTSCTEPSLPDQPGAHHLLLIQPSNSGWIPLLTGAPQALISSQDGGGGSFPLPSSPKPLPSLSFPPRTPAPTSSMTAIVFYGLCILLCRGSSQKQESPRCSPWLEMAGERGKEKQRANKTKIISLLIILPLCHLNK